MTRVLIISDSHGLTEELTMIKERHQTDYMIHCGDSELDFDQKEMEGFYKVAGNCDFDGRYPNEQLLTINGLTFFVAHGHLHHVKRNVMAISYRAEEENAQIVCFGHTHIAGAEKIGNQVLINPGSIHQPRYRQEKTYALMEWKSPEEMNIYFYTINGNKVDGLFYRTSL